MRSSGSKPNVASALSARQRVDAYADAVLAGAILAGPCVRAACARHQKDCARQGTAELPYLFNDARAQHIVEFFEQVLRLPDLVDEDGQPRPFLLEPWQVFIVGSLFGWVDAKGQRRFREAYIEIGKGNGKTPMCAGIGLYGLVMDAERAAEIYAAAADQDQAAILFRDAVRIADASPELGAILTKSGGEHVWKLDHKPSLSFFRMFSRDSGAKSGPRPHMGLLDELHEHGTPQISLKVRAGAKRRTQPMFIEITNSGFDRTTICWEHHEHSRKVAEGSVTDEQWFAYVCALDEADDPLHDESCWPKVNPNLGVSVTEAYLRAQVKNALNMPLEHNTILRLNFCVWTHAESRLIPMDKWALCKTEIPDAELVGAPCYAGLDLGQSDDFTAFIRIWLLSESRVAVRCRFWVPALTLQKYPDRPYDVWRRQGILSVTSGEVTDLDLVERDVMQLCQESGVRECAYDKRFAEHMALHLRDAGVTMVDTPQGDHLHEALGHLLDWIVCGKLSHGGHEILTWMAANAVSRVSTATGRMRLDKDKSADKIDGIMALTMATDRAFRNPLTSVYETRPALVF